MSLFWIKLSVLLSVHDLFTHSNTLYNITIGIDTFRIHADTFSLTSGTGTIHIQEVHIGKTLTAYSAAGKIFCQLSGKASNYDIDCRADRKDIQQPIYPSNADSEKKIILHSGMYVPKLSFMD